MFVIPDKTPDFLFELDGEKYAMPAVDAMPIEDVLTVSKLREGGDPLEAVRWFIAYVDRYCGGICEGLTVAQLNALMDAYFNSAKSDVGE